MAVGAPRGRWDRPRPWGSPGPESPASPRQREGQGQQDEEARGTRRTHVTARTDRARVVHRATGRRRGCLRRVEGSGELSSRGAVSVVAGLGDRRARPVDGSRSGAMVPHGESVHREDARDHRGREGEQDHAPDDSSPVAWTAAEPAPVRAHAPSIGGQPLRRPTSPPYPLWVGASRERAGPDVWRPGPPGGGIADPPGGPGPPRPGVPRPAQRPQRAGRIVPTHSPRSMTDPSGPGAVPRSVTV